MNTDWICKLHALVDVGLENNAMQQWLSDQDIVKIALKTDLDDAFGDQSTQRRQLHFITKWPIHCVCSLTMHDYSYYHTKPVDKR